MSLSTSTSQNKLVNIAFGLQMTLLIQFKIPHLTDNKKQANDSFEPEVPIISSRSTLQVLNKVWDYLMQQNNAKVALCEITAVENTMQQAVTQSMRQLMTEDGNKKI